MCRAIHTAKNSLDLDMDSEVGLNRQRQDLLRYSATWPCFATAKRPLPAEAPASDSTARETRSPTDVMPRRSPTIDFDRNKIRGMATALSKKADEISMSLDKCLVNTEVSYEPPFDMNDSFEDILSDFIEKSTAA